ncbi:MAG: putative peptide modification system cyclase, partial [Gammaproteobacteria bacterium]|nr:putative peptide modification system cyclase [Gammaproteobacteria bacterium]
QERLAGRPEEAIHILEDEIDGAELVQARVAMAAALADAGRPGAALEHLDWVIQHRGRAYMEANASQVLQTLNVIDTRFAQLKAAEMLVAAKEPGPAIERVRLLSKDWPRNHMPGYLRRRMDEIFPASKQ